jgi:hypothetical protein
MPMSKYLANCYTIMGTWMRLQELFSGVIKASAAIFVFGCSIGQAHAHNVLTLTQQGTTRTATIHEPPAMPASPAPVVIALHDHGHFLRCTAIEIEEHRTRPCRLIWRVVVDAAVRPMGIHIPDRCPVQFINRAREPLV